MYTYYGLEREQAVLRSHDLELEPSIFTFVVSTFATNLSTCLLRIVAKVLTTKVKKEGSVTFIRNSKGDTLNYMKNESSVTIVGNSKGDTLHYT